MKISFITTIFNEAQTIETFLDSLFSQSKMPDEIIIVDGGSNDDTVDRIKKYEVRSKRKKILCKVITKKGNRSVGRNEAIKHATGDIIVCSDSGNILDKNWVKNIVEPFKNKKIDVVAGYYKGKANTIFQKCLVPYALVMDNNVDKDNFLPATRSIAFTKKIWKKVKGFDERYSHNEDYVFANLLKDKGAKIVFAKEAIVYWIPRTTFKEAFIMFFRFALGDAEAGIWRSKVLLLLARYFLVLYFIFFCLLYKSLVPLVVLSVAFIIYIIFSINKNYQYVRHKKAFILLPLLQFTADAAVLTGTLAGMLKNIKRFMYRKYVKENFFFFFIVFVYIAAMATIFTAGAPNEFHPYPYNMDEWHQLQAVRATFKYGTPNVFGAANGTMFQFLLSGFYLIPFTLLHYIDPAVLKVNDFMMRERVFELLRLNTLLFGMLSLGVLYKIIKILSVPKRIAIALFTFTPIFLSLTNFFKYDIALLFWILLSLYYMLKFAQKPTNRNFIIAAIPSALALAVKISAMPIAIMYIISYFLFYPLWKKNLKYLFVGGAVFVFCFLIFGLPDTLFGKGNILLYFFENVVQAPATSSNYLLGMPPLQYLFTIHYPMIFGHAFIYLFVASVFFWIYCFLKEKGYKEIQKYKIDIFIFFSLLIFIVSLIPLQIFAGANRSVVLLPFFVLIIGLGVKKALAVSDLRKLTIIIVSFVIAFQIAESFALLAIKRSESPQAVSSEWLESNVPAGSVIGIENIPIYQNIPDIIEKEYYYNQSKIKQNNNYTYEIIDSKTKELPSTIVITWDDNEVRMIKESPKKSLVERIKREDYKRIAVFSPDLTYYKLFNHPDDYYFYSWLIALPQTISVYVK